MVFYHFPLNTLDKNENVLLPDLQTNCRYDRGMELIFLFGEIEVRALRFELITYLHKKKFAI